VRKKELNLIKKFKSTFIIQYYFFQFSVFRHIKEFNSSILNWHLFAISFAVVLHSFARQERMILDYLIHIKLRCAQRNRYALR